MSQLAASDGQLGNWEEPDFFLRRLETVRFRTECWQEPCESRGSCMDLCGTGGEIPPVYPTPKRRMPPFYWDIEHLTFELISKYRILWNALQIVSFFIS